MNRRSTAMLMLKFCRLTPSLLDCDELHHVRVVYREYAHVGAASGAALFDYLGAHVVCLDEAAWAGRDTAGGLYFVTLWP